MMPQPRMSDYEFHPIANIFPLMEGSEFAALVADIKANGLQDDILIFDGKIIDGRNRYRACEEASEKPRFRELGHLDNPLAFVISKNLHRRHLSESQRAMIAADIANLANGAQICAASDISQDKAAEMMTVGRRTTQLAKKVKDDAEPEIEEQVRAGNLSVDAGAKAADLPKKQQKAVARVAETEGKKAAAKAVKAAIDEQEESEEEPEESFVDDNLIELPDHLIPAWKVLPDFREFSKDIRNIDKELDRLIGEARRLKKSPAGYGINENAVCSHLRTAAHSLKSAKESLWCARPAFICPYCKAKKKSCEACKGKGWVDPTTYKTAPKE